ncbi:MAG: hypothetical protein VX938_06460, partial [Myxococcota bacterium]|nr:hypothetical protein [Myxococcota bacterium]
PWTEAELAGWGDPQALLQQTGGHVELLVDPEGGMERFRGRLESTLASETVGEESLKALLTGPSTPMEIADRIDAFSPEVDLSMRRLLDHLVEAQRPPDEPGGSPERIYSLYPATRLALGATGGA